MIIIVGASASGKTVTALDLQKRYNIKKAITTTTRPMRINEVDGVDYFFITKEEFEKKLNEGKFVESTLYNGNYYGCGKDQVEDDKVVVVDPNGLHSFLKLNDSHIVTFLLTSCEATRNSRMLGRGDKLERIKERLTNDKVDFSVEKIGQVDFVIPTDDISIEEVSDIIYKLYKERLSK